MLLLSERDVYLIDCSGRGGDSKEGQVCCAGLKIFLLFRFLLGPDAGD
jgi:hypothetical protein